jgi:UDP-N-acetyl-2-amino-2-deoxyglucuronate dehydrogenase
MIRVAVVGTGNIAHSHVEAFLGFRDRCVITDLVDIVPGKAADFGRFHNLSAGAFESHRAILEREDVDLVTVCTPPFTHAGIAGDFLGAGKHVIVEKPMAASIEECDRLAGLAAENRRVFSPIAQNRFRTPIMRLKKVLDSGLIGKVLHAQVDSFWWRGHGYYDLWWRGTWEKEGGGCTLNHAVHHIDLLLWMKGMPETVTAVLANAAHDNAEVEDLSVAILKYADGSLGQLTASVVHHGEEQQLVFQGRDARISAPFRVTASLSKANGFPEPNPELEKRITAYHDAVPEVRYDAHAGQIDDVLRAVETGSKPLIGAEDGRNTIQLISAIYASASTGGPVALPLKPGDPFYTAAGVREHSVHFYEKTASKQDLSNESITTGADYKKLYNYKGEKPQ